MSWEGSWLKGAEEDGVMRPPGFVGGRSNRAGRDSGRGGPWREHDSPCCVYSRALIAILLQSYFLRMRGSTFISVGLKNARLLSGETQGTESSGPRVWTVHTALPTGTLPTPSVFFLLPSRATGSPAVRVYAQWASIHFWRRPDIQQQQITRRNFISGLVQWAEHTWHQATVGATS